LSLRSRFATLLIRCEQTEAALIDYFGTLSIAYEEIGVDPL
jgi:hypothetical protein